MSRPLRRLEQSTASLSLQPTDGGEGGPRGDARMNGGANANHGNKQGRASRCNHKRGPVFLCWLVVPSLSIFWVSHIRRRGRFPACRRDKRREKRKSGESGSEYEGKKMVTLNEEAKERPKRKEKETYSVKKKKRFAQPLD